MVFNKQGNRKRKRRRKTKMIATIKMQVNRKFIQTVVEQNYYYRWFLNLAKDSTIEAHLRKGRGVIGAYGPEKFPKVPEKKKEEDAEEGNDPKGKLLSLQRNETSLQSGQCASLHRRQRPICVL